MRIAALALALSVLSSGPALSGELLINQKLDSPALGKPIVYHIYLPSGADGQRRYPVVYLLHGYGGGRDEWRMGGHVAQTLDRMIAAGDLEPVIAVLPEGGTSWFVDSARHGGQGDFETAITRDLVRGVDAAYPTIADAKNRTIAGNSMGGYGALRLAFAHPETFSAVVALSPAVYKPDGVSWSAGPASFSAEEREKWYAKVTGETFDFDVFKALSPFALIDGAAKRDPPTDILLAVGDSDELDLQDGTLELYLELRRAGLEPELRVSHDTHGWDYWRRLIPEVFTFLERKRAPPEPGPESAKKERAASGDDR